MTITNRTGVAVILHREVRLMLKKCSKLHPVMQPAATIDNYITSASTRTKYQYLKFPSFTYTLKSLMPPGTLLSMRGKYWMAVRVCFAPKSITTV